MTGAEQVPGTLFVITAPSGTGKSTIASRLLERTRRLRFSVSYTTRKPRQGEQDGREYHFVDDDENPPELYTQIPDGYAGAASPIDPSRADASPWIEELPVIREFRRRFKIKAPSSGSRS